MQYLLAAFNAERFSLRKSKIPSVETRQGVNKGATPEGEKEIDLKSPYESSNDQVKFFQPSKSTRLGSRP